mmetsp:Transcript_16425/g.46604  ORF Transcript_16425/g.46604 Transcript_16425/m.46604 type:complete len:200 (-) Transcript_16425:1499-2098(-)
MYDAGLEARYAPLTQKIPLGVQLGWLGAALVAASLSKEGRLVTEADVRGGAARPFLPFAREDRSRRAHARPSSTTPRRAGPQSGRAPAFLGRSAAARVRRRAPVAVDVRQGPGKTTGEAVQRRRVRGRGPRERRDELRRQRARAVLYIFASPARRPNSRLRSSRTPRSRTLSRCGPPTRAKRHAPANRRKTEMTPRLRR